MIPNQILKVKAWDSVNNKMYFGDDIDLIIRNGIVVSELWRSGKYICDDILLPYSGFDDINGIELYSGDIIMCRLGGVPEGFLVKQMIHYNDGMFNSGGIPMKYIDNMRFIGNYYSNPELRV
jgi:hypothetical protein